MFIDKIKKCIFKTVLKVESVVWKRQLLTLKIQNKRLFIFFFLQM